MAKLAAFDMDGTLLLPDHSLGNKTISTLKRVSERGVTLAFATGRHALDMVKILGNADLNAFLITGNGTRIHSREGELLHSDDLAPEVAEIVLHSHWDTSASLHVFNDKGWFTAQPVPEMLAAHADSGFAYQLMDLRRLPAYDVTKACFCGEHEDLLRLRIQLNETLHGRANICFSAWECLEVLPLASNKGSALQILGQQIGLNMSDCMAFGDAMNDKEMLAGVGRGFIMGNAMPELKAALPHLPIIGHCRQQAVSHYLTHWLETPHLTYSPEV
ncbi:HMP-PP phosphatase [Salmonella enterica subsp. enterica serovar Choleraesuis]|nr:HMP-PP phosphatase [Salmonella enterica subsp. enterica serovar Choleraesuis]